MDQSANSNPIRQKVLPNAGRGIMTYSFLERGQPDALLLPALGRVIKQDTRAQDVDLPIVEDFHKREESAVGVSE